MSEISPVPASKKCSITMLAGKGGVGKTTCAAATALHSASLGKPTLAISTDATPSLLHIFEKTDGQKPAKVAESLFINELGVDEVKEIWDKKFGREVYTVFSSFVAIDYEQFVDFMTSILPGLGDEFMLDYIRELSQKNEYDSIIWDTAPLGQTLALLQTPAMLRKHLRLAPRVYSKLKLQRNREPVLDILKRWEKLSAENMKFLQNEVQIVLVTIPEALAVEQLEGVFHELNNYGLKVHQLVINNVVKVQTSDFLKTKASQQKNYIDLIHLRYSGLRITEIPMFPYEIKGLHRVKKVEEVLFH